MSRGAYVALALAAIALGGCEGIGRPLVGDRPLEERMPDDQCFAVDCDTILDPIAPPFEAPTVLGAELEGCQTRGDVTLLVGDEGRIDVPEIACADVLLETDRAFFLDLRARDLVGTRLTVRATELGQIALSGDVHHLSLDVDGPVEVVMDGGALSRSSLALTAAPAQRAGQLHLEDVIATELRLVASIGTVRAHHASLSRVQIVAREAALEISSVTFGSIVAERMSFLDAELLSVHLEVDTLVSAAGHLDRVDISRCGQVSLALTEVRRSFIAACDEPIYLEDVDMEASLVSADVQGSGRFRRTGFAGASVVLESSRLTLAALCGVVRLDVSTTSVECPSCEPTAPAEICGAPTVEQPFCPGYDVSPCSEGPRPSPLPVEPTTTET
ncbi:MAG: hypothetical protein J0L92_00355 [Deltaproteobacteria bacterium]|nr:hypothetical protein [Deltaproteobacteria bacterium]